MRKRASYGAGRTFVQDGFDARTGDEREPREQPWGGRERKGMGRRGRGKGFRHRTKAREREREKRRSEIARRSAKWRKGERGRPNSASLSSTTGLRNTHTVRPPIVHGTVNRERCLPKWGIKITFPSANKYSIPPVSRDYATIALEFRIFPIKNFIKDSR